jgi:hypothetical protein
MKEPLLNSIHINSSSGSITPLVRKYLNARRFRGGRS